MNKAPRPEGSQFSEEALKTVEDYKDEQLIVVARRVLAKLFEQAVWWKVVEAELLNRDLSIEDLEIPPELRQLLGV
jgi:hypothetical protein